MSTEYGPLGPGKDPVKDPMKGFRSVVSGTLVMEAITIFLSLTVILKVGDLWTPFNWGFVLFLGFAHLILAFCQRFSWGLTAALVLQAVGLIGGFFVHWSLALIIAIFCVVWYYILSMRRILIQRMKRGLLTTQHLGTE